ncbi:DNA repair protein XRCC2 [Megalops cyprinoides]|uniref:DNA repair protein XRCC2 n=1 Tax=Megalops cyprinoides TaxID=118141 RepID=UPI001863ABA7|nr:DNA repair protein XRCC2 [Megalops cyprinoides]
MSHQARSAESGVQLLARLEGRRSLENIEPRLFPEDAGPAKGDVVEFHGAEGTGKTEMLYHLLARCILPAEGGGLEAEAVLVDTDYHFDVLRLVTVLERRLPAGLGEEAVRSSLGRLYVAHCSGSTQLLLTLHYLEGVFCSRPAIATLVLDSVSAFYWVDRACGGESLARQEANLRKCARLLERFLRYYGIVVFATTHAIMRNYTSEAEASSSSSSFSSCRRGPPAPPTDLSKAYLCKAWHSIVTHKVFFTKGEVAKDKKQVFSVTSYSRTKRTTTCSFCVTDARVQFL